MSSAIVKKIENRKKTTGKQFGGILHERSLDFSVKISEILQSQSADLEDVIDLYIF